MGPHGGAAGEEARGESSPERRQQAAHRSAAPDVRRSARDVPARVGEAGVGTVGGVPRRGSTDPDDARESITRG